MSRVKFKCFLKRFQALDDLLRFYWLYFLGRDASKSIGLISVKIIRKWEFICIDCSNDMELFCSQTLFVTISFSLSWVVMFDISKNIQSPAQERRAFQQVTRTLCVNFRRKYSS